MKKIVALCVAPLALMSAPAFADTYTPDGATYPANWVLTGTVNVNKGIPLQCAIRIEVDVAADGRSATATPSLSGGFLNLCDDIIFNNTPYPVDFDGTTSTLTLSGVDVTTPTPGGCSGSIGGTWNNTTKVLTISASLPGGGGTAACTVAGSATLVSPSGGSIVDP